MDNTTSYYNLSNQKPPLGGGLAGIAYRNLRSEEISILKSNACWAEDWDDIEVAEEGFLPQFVQRTNFYGKIRIGALDGTIEVTRTFPAMPASRTLPSGTLQSAITA